MTTIAVSKTQIAGDRQLTHSNGIKFRSASKLHGFENPLIYPKKFVVGLCGNIEVCLNVLDFFTNPVEWKAPKGMKGTEFVVLTEDKKIFTFTDPREWLPVQEKYYSIGSGCHFAMGAMEAGKTALEAVKAAAKLDSKTGMGFTHYTLA